MASSWFVPLEGSSRDCLTLRIQHSNRSESRKVRIYVTTQILFTPINLTVHPHCTITTYRRTFSQRERSYVAPAFEITALPFKRDCLQFRYILPNDVERRRYKIHDRLRHALGSNAKARRVVKMLSEMLQSFLENVFLTSSMHDKLSLFFVSLLVLVAHSKSLSRVQRLTDLIFVKCRQEREGVGDTEDVNSQCKL